jgi:hypothetical protein
VFGFHIRDEEATFCDECGGVGSEAAFCLVVGIFGPFAVGRDRLVSEFTEVAIELAVALFILGGGIILAFGTDGAERLLAVDIFLDTSLIKVREFDSEGGDSY